MLTTLLKTSTVGLKLGLVSHSQTLAWLRETKLGLPLKLAPCCPVRRERAEVDHSC